ncbi:PucR family transcriptional regulator [Paenibacillus swuensis]|uniref:PucR family transcriptional regulator n=1 Tax=Paenibacillus swuensis TaxID=1178515 RepID=A0A172TLF3_9BACL|nr:PucR family transcriptional regulator ligand-binding domain-containing protein [Paenibacillus swuensis]ANE47647.1 PucR family transcriptional regulator [Paenibacillus swuensis]
MHLTVEQALSVYPLSQGKLVAGAAGVNRIVKSINVMDAPDISEWIKEGEMLFTTAYLIKDNPDDAVNLLQQLNKGGSSGLGIKLGRFWESIPEDLITCADRMGFPLIELPYPFTFSDQMNGLFQAEIKKSTSLLQEVLDKQVRLMQFALRSNHIREMFDAIANVIGYPMAIVGSRGQMIYNSSTMADQQLLQQWPWPPHKKWTKQADGQAFRVPLMKDDQATGAVYFFNNQSFLSSIEEGLYVQAAEILSYHMNFNYEDYFEHSVQKDFSLLIKRYLKNGLPLETLMDYAERWEMEWLHKSYRCVLTDFPSMTTGPARTENIRRMKAEYISHARIQDLKGTHTILEEGVLSIYPEPPEAESGYLEQAIAACLDTVRFQDKMQAKVAISSRKKLPKQLHEAYGECRETQRLSLEWKIGGSIVPFEMLDVAMIFEGVSREKMQTFCDRWLGGLLSKDPDYVFEMLRTLETYLECDGQLNETAKKLFIHRNTATYRIEKLSEMLDVDFKNINDLMRLKMAFLFRSMLQRDSVRSDYI